MSERYWVLDPDGSYTYGQPEVIDDLLTALCLAEDASRWNGRSSVVGTDIKRCVVVSRCPSGGDCGSAARGRCDGLESVHRPIGCPRRSR